MLENYNNIKKDYNPNILIGNGFSASIFNDFLYKGLFQLCIKENLLKSSDLALFKKFDTVDFEYILRLLYITSEVNKTTKQGFKNHGKKYESIKNALIEAVQKIHPKHNFLENNGSLVKVLKKLSFYKKIFTLNYDLIPYWSIMEQKSKFTDLFFNGEYFDISNVSFSGKIPIYYLHGSLYLYREKHDSFLLEDTKTRKLKSKGDLLETLKESFEKGQGPLFVSEGSEGKNNQKLIKINSNQYLRFCYDELKKISGNLTIIGASLSPADSHIIDAIKENTNLDNIAISIWKGKQSKEQIYKEEHRIISLLHKEKRKIVFYDSDSFWE